MSKSGALFLLYPLLSLQTEGAGVCRLVAPLGAHTQTPKVFLTYGPFW